MLLAGQRLKHQLHGGVVIRQLLDLDLVLLVRVLVRQVGLVAADAHADALDEALGDDRFVLHVDQLILQRGRTGVDDQNFHLLSSPR